MHEKLSENQKHVSAEKREAKKHKQDHDPEQFFQVRLSPFFSVACVCTQISAVLVAYPAWTEDFVPVEVKSEQSWKQAKTHHEPAILTAEQGAISEGASVGPESTIVLVSLRFAPLTLRSLRNLTTVFIVIVFSRVFLVFLGEDWNQFIFIYATFADRTNQSLVRLL